ncbi:MAG: hypothetical protein RBS73_13990 [Prolixibacteraceae bacterium]|jgi:hypothetical protein|nr:hypothetical protein [Prolixibacteraceae bacterium]
MKHNTHIYLAVKGIEFLYEGLSNLQDLKTGQKVSTTTITKMRREGKILQRMLMHYQDMISEASWAPDDILNDKVQYHTFKLYTEDEFPGSKIFAKEIHRDKYYRASGGGGLPYKVDHLARVISDMDKLRRYNDRCTMNQIMYQYLMLSHYIVDAHVPMHCDLRDDPPTDTDMTKPKNGNYYSDSLHGKIEQLWEDAVTPIAIKEGILRINRKDDDCLPVDLSKQIEFRVINDDHCNEITPHFIADKDLMDYMIDLCIRTKERSLLLFPINDPTNWNKQLFFQLTREIFAQAISSLISVWIWIWMKSTN